MTGVGELGHTVSQADPHEEPSDVLVRQGPIQQFTVGRVCLFRCGAESPSTVAKSGNGQRGQQCRLCAMPHGVGDGGVEVLAVYGVIERVATSVVGRLQPTGDGKGPALDRVGGG